MEQWWELISIRFEKLEFTLQKQLYDSYYRFVYRNIFFIIRDHALTEDVIQDSFLKLITKGPELTSNQNLLGWIKQVTHRTVLDYLRKIKKERLLIEKSIVYSEYDNYSDIHVINQVEIKLKQELLRKSMMELRPIYRIILNMHYIEDKSYKEICKELNITMQILTQSLARARKKLRKILSDKCFEDY